MFQVLPRTDAYLRHAYKENKRFEMEGDYKLQTRMFLKELLEKSMQEEIRGLIELDPYEHSQTRVDYRNGTYARRILTELGDIEISIPRLRKRCIEFKVLGHYQRRTRDIDKLIVGCFVHGHSTRKVAEALLPLLGERISSSTVSRLSRSLDDAVFDYHERVLADRYRFLFFDGIVLKSRYGGKGHKKTVLCAYGMTEGGVCEIIDFMVVQGESQQSWEGFINDLQQRGLKMKKTELIVTDGGVGLHAALEVACPRIRKQRCWAHKTRNVLDKVKKKDWEAVKKMIHRIWGAKNLTEATRAYWRFARKWRNIYPKAVHCIEKDLEELLAFYQIKGSGLWSKIRTTNPIERAFREVRRRTRPMGVFVNNDSIERILFAVFNHLNNQWKLHPLKIYTK